MIMLTERRADLIHEDNSIPGQSGGSTSRHSIALQPCLPDVELPHHSQEEELSTLQEQDHHGNPWNQSHGEPLCCYVYEIGIYGWRRLCFYMLLILIVAVVLINALLTIFIAAVLQNGMGRLKFQANGLKVNGDAYFMKDVYARHLRSPKDRVLKFFSGQEIAIHARNSDGEVINRLFMRPTLVGATSNNLVVRGLHGKLLLMLNDDNVVLATEKLRVSSLNGIKFNSSLQALLIQSATHQELRLESLTRCVHIRGPQSVSLEGLKGQTSLRSLKHLTFKSKVKPIILNSSQIEFKNLPIALPTNRGRTYPGIHQLCICANTGQLFMASPEGSCHADKSVCKTIENSVSSSSGL